MLNIDENTGLNGNITVEDGGKTVTVLLVSCNLNSSATNLLFSVNVVNKDLLAANLQTVQQQLADFKTQVQNKMKDLGYQITF